MSAHYLWEHPEHTPRVARPEDADFARTDLKWVRCYPVEVCTPAAVETARQWISVEDYASLPSNDKDVLLAFRDRSVFIGFRTFYEPSEDEAGEAGHEWRDQDDNSLSDEPTHWAPLPDAPGITQGSPVGQEGKSHG